MNQDGSSTTLIFVVATHNPLAFFYRAFIPTIKINGAVHRLPWGAHKFEVPPGTYQVSVSYPWLLSPECGKNTVNLELKAGQRKTVTYCARLIRFIPGSIKVT